MNSSSSSGGAPRFATELLERRLQRPERARSTPPGRRPRRSGRRRIARERRRQLPGPSISAGLQETIRTQGRPDAGRAGKETTLSSTITSGSDLVDDLDQALVDVTGAVAERLEGRGDETLELLDRRLAEDRAPCRG